ncbi:MAG: hypothetical protein IIZ38_04395 [Sphingomonas sp.]|uniref:hypothetical protein n=1 Tax=Sphingomonas sp. TaxID=28214 RepID=UPI0025D0D4FD|nr:hypothetical protein [Sphingomonas sp.]MBQ1497534.1 hypothetical protein [Sphingomonas sp.]
MRYVVLFAPQPLQLDQLVSRAPEMQWTAHPRHDDPAKFEFHGILGGERVRLWPFGQDDSSWAEEPERLARIRSMGPSRENYFVHFHDAAQLKAVLTAIADDPNFLIDDDYDLFVRGDEFAEYCRTASDTKWLMNGDFG